MLEPAGDVAATIYWDEGRKLGATETPADDRAEEPTLEEV